MTGVPGSAGDPSHSATALDPFENEQRYVLTRAQAVDFFASVGTRVALELYDRSRPVSFTRTTYLDTEDFAYFRSCDSPIARRLRIREYAVAAAPDAVAYLSGVCFLELKQTSGTARSKIRLSAPPPALARIIASGGRVSPDDPMLSVVEPLAALDALGDELQTARMAPRLSTWYRRTCMTGEGGRVRITLDEGLLFSLPQPIGAPGSPVAPLDVIARGPGRVLEIKHWGETPEWLGNAVEELNAAPHFSKFHIGMLALSQVGAVPELPQERSTTPAPALFVLSGPGRR
jgi:hypothetical protein